jgi:hypothetical protein
LSEDDVSDDHDDIESHEQREGTAEVSEHPREVEIARGDHGRLPGEISRVSGPGDVIEPPTRSRIVRDMRNTPRNAGMAIVAPMIAGAVRAGRVIRFRQAKCPTT